MKYNALILAAGKGTRMKTELPKCALPLLKKPMISYITDSLYKSNISNIIVVVGHKSEVIKEILGNEVKYSYQSQQLGTANAVFCAKDKVDMEDYSIIIPGDTPLIDEDIIRKIIEFHESEKNDFTIGTLKVDNPYGFGRIIKDDNKIIKIIEEKDANEEEKNIKEINTGVYCIKNQLLFSAIDKVNNNNKKREYYLTDIVEILSNKAKIASYTFDEPYKLMGINDLFQLSVIEEQLRMNINKKHMLNGVAIINSNTVTIGPDVTIGNGTIIYQGSMIMGKTNIGNNCIIGPNCEISNSKIENNSKCIHSVVYDSTIKEGASVGPFSHLRMNTVIGENDRIGNFVEIKNSTLGNKTNVAHLTYIGDTACGSHVNFGCGCVTVNYDGKNKNKTTIGDNVFIGCNSNLIAPVTIESESFIAAGTTITKKVEKGDFAIGRVKQENKKGYAQKYNFVKKNVL